MTIPGNYWNFFTQDGSNFSHGDARFFFPDQTGKGQHILIICVGIRLNPAEVRETLPTPPALQRKQQAVEPPALAPVAQSANKGGRPPKGWWDDLWVEMARQLYDGELIPKRQADIEKAMADWVFALGHEAGERTFRDAARKLWRAINKEGKN